MAPIISNQEHLFFQSAERNHRSATECRGHERLGERTESETASSRLGATRARRQLMLENAAAKGDLEHLRDLLEVLQIRASECASVSYLTHGQRFAV